MWFEGKGNPPLFLLRCALFSHPGARIHQTGTFPISVISEWPTSSAHAQWPTKFDLPYWSGNRHYSRRRGTWKCDPSRYHGLDDRTDIQGHPPNRTFPSWSDRQMQTQGLGHVSNSDSFIVSQAYLGVHTNGSIDFCSCAGNSARRTRQPWNRLGRIAEREGYGEVGRLCQDLNQDLSVFNRDKAT